MKYECKECGKRYKTVIWSIKHNINKHDGKAKFKQLGKIKDSDDT